MSEECKLLVPLANPRTAEELIRIAAGIADGRPGYAIALGVVEVPEEKSLSEGALLARQKRRLLQQVLDWGQAEGLEVRTAVRIARQAWQGIQEVVREEGVNLIVFGWRGAPPARAAQRPFGFTIDQVVKKPPCDIAMVKQRGFGQCRRILLPVRGGPHAELALRLVLNMAHRFGSKVTILHIRAPKGARAHEADRRVFERFAALVQGLRNVRLKTVEAASVEEAILREAKGHQLVVMGAAARPGSSGYLFGRIAENVATRCPVTTMVVKTAQLIDLSIFGPAEESVGEVVDKWFAENTFHAREFSDIAALVELKRRQGLTISLGLPALNEAATVGQIIRTLKPPLMEQHPLLDEMVLIDSGSTDGTVEIARGLGIPVYDHREILPSQGTYAGKGEALWKSLYVLKGDIILWLDTDIRNMHPKFVYGLVGPLLHEPRIKYVKGFYRRPIRIGAVSYETGGGRVTELTARPLLNLFFPLLSGLVQPLSGEYAGRREVLEAVSFFTGYGVETGLLIDILDRFGLAAIGQTDLEERIHRNQSLMALSKMAFAIVQVVVKRLEDRSKVQLLEAVNRSMKLIVHEPDRFYLDVKEIGDAERPPIASIAEYRRRAG